MTWAAAPRKVGGMQIRILIAACALLLLVTASASAQQPLTASFTYAPAQPVAGQNVTFTSTSTGSPDVTVWDLDNDGAYDDGSGTTARRAFPAGDAHGAAEGAARDRRGGGVDLPPVRDRQGGRGRAARRR